MKNELMTIVCAAAMVMASTNPACAAPETDPEPVVVAADAVIMRPALFAATVAGSVIFVAILPVSALSKSVKSTARALVLAPAKATFTRPLGDFDYAEPSLESQIAANN